MVENYIKYTQKDSPNMITGLTPYQILGTLTSQTKTDMKFVERKGRRSRVIRYVKGFTTVFSEKNLCTSELCEVIPARFLDIWTFSHTKIQKGHAQFLYHFGFSRCEDSKTSGGCVPGILVAIGSIPTNSVRSTIISRIIMIDYV